MTADPRRRALPYSVNPKRTEFRVRYRRVGSERIGQRFYQLRSSADEFRRRLFTKDPARDLARVEWVVIDEREVTPWVERERWRWYGGGL